MEIDNALPLFVLLHGQLLSCIVDWTEKIEVRRPCMTWTMPDFEEVRMDAEVSMYILISE